MLLTSSQVSVAVSSGVVILCTFALFLSGYALQQRTLRQLRESIRQPRPEPPKIFLPDRFNKMTTELDDGTIITIDENGNKIEGDNNSADKGPSSSQESPAVGSHKDVVVEVRPSIAGAEDGQKQQRLSGQENSEGHEEKPQSTTQTTEQQIPEESKLEQPKPEAPPSSAPEETAKKTGDAEKKQKPVSKAERRRLIKEELMKMAYNDKPVYYQRRLY